MIWRLFCAILMLGVVHGCGGDSGNGGPTDPGGTNGDETAPAAVADLRVNSLSELVLEVIWTAPGDDGDEGTATTYDVRYSAMPITEANWESRSPAPFVPDPEAAGTQQTAQITSPPKPDVYVAIKVADEVPNWSVLSNVVHANTDPGGLEIRQLETDGSDDHPSVHDGYVCWISHQGGVDEIYIANTNDPYPSPTQVTDNGGEKDFPSNRGQHSIVWQGREDPLADWEIWSYYLYGDPPRYDAFTDDEVDDTRPVLAGGGDFAWLHGGTVHEAVHYWNADSHSRFSISDDCCPTTGWFAESMTAHDGQVVWRAVDRVGNEGYLAKSWNGVLRDISDELNCPLSIDYSLYDGAVAFEYLDGTERWIGYWDGVSPFQQIAKGYDPSLYAGGIAYEGWDGDSEIFYWDGVQSIRITDNDYPDTQPALHDGVIAWTGRPPGSQYQIFYVKLEE